MSTKSELESWDDNFKDWEKVDQFFEFLNNKNIELGIWNSGTEFALYHGKLIDLYYEFCGIDKNKLEKERRELLDSIGSKQ